MKTRILLILCAYAMLFHGVSLKADCPLDHFLVGINPDGIAGTADDLKLFVDCWEIYRHSDPLDNQDPTWAYWHYPLYSSIYGGYTNGEPGFDFILVSDDPNQAITGTPLVDYNLWIEVVSIAPGFYATWDGEPEFFLLNAGDKFDYTALGDPHQHFNWNAPTDNNLYWISFRIYDALGKYQPSDVFSVVFIKDPLAGNLVFDDVIDINDLSQFCYYWLQDNGSSTNDYYQRADMNKDGTVNFVDFALMANNWHKQQN